MRHEPTARGGPRPSRGLAVAAMLCFGLSLPGNAALAAPPGTATITGIVLDAVSGEPIAGAVVSDPSSPSPAVTSAANGVYTFTTVPGTHQLQARAPGRPVGYFADFEQSLPSRTFTLADGQDRDTGDIFLDPPAGVATGQISGGVLADGNAVAGITVKIYLSGTTTVAAQATTDENGNYSVENLPDGDYQVFFDASGTSFGSAWYVAAENQASAARVQITEGGSQGSIDASLIGGFTAAPVPTVSGTGAVGQTLTAVVGSWTPAPTLTYRWLRDGAAISGATGTSYLVQAADTGRSLTFEVTGKKSGVLTATRTSAPLVIGQALTAAPVPTLTGTFAVGQTVTAVPGTWAPSPVAVTYQWAAGGTAIAGATNATYVVTAAEAGKTMTVTVTGTKAGYVTTAKTSAPSAAVAAANLVSATPTITGTATVGQALTANPGAWGPAPVTFTYQWAATGQAIAGATSATFVPTASEVGKRLTVTVTGTKPGYTTASKSSAATAAVIGTALTTAVPTITGNPAVGSTVTAVPGTWGPAPVTLAYQWLRAGTPISGATASTYLLDGDDATKQVSVRITGTKAGYAAATTTSPAVNVSALGNTLKSGQQLNGTQTLTSPGGQFTVSVSGGLREVEFNNRTIWSATGTTGRLVMQTDGNLVMYSTSNVVMWASSTFDNPGAKAVLQSDGNFVVYSAAGKALWANYPVVDQLLSTQTPPTSAVLRVGDRLQSVDGRTRLVLQSDGNLVLYGPRGAMWWTGTNKGTRLVLQSDGNLVLYSATGAPVWATMTGSANAGQRRLVVQSDGNLVEYGPSGAVWSTRTRA